MWRQRFVPTLVEEDQRGIGKLLFEAALEFVFAKSRTRRALARLVPQADFRLLYGERFTGLSEIPSRCALLRMAASGRPNFKLRTPVGVLPRAS
jgi:hypothetical protein